MYLSDLNSFDLKYDSFTFSQTMTKFTDLETDIFTHQINGSGFTRLDKLSSKVLFFDPGTQDPTYILSHGGGIFIDASASAGTIGSITNCLFPSLRATIGSAIYLQDSFATISGTSGVNEFTGNIPVDGTIYLVGSTVELNNLGISNNVDSGTDVI